MITEKEKQIIEKIARKLYSPLPYHNFQHALQTIKISEEIIMKCEEEKIQVNKRVIYYALLFHDSGYAENNLDNGFKTKEEYSAFLAERELKKLEVKEIKEIKKAIISTNQKSKFLTNEEKIVRSSDLWGLAEDYEIFLKNNENLKQEAELLSKKQISNEEWKKQTKKIIEFYLSQNIHVTNRYYNKGKSIFHKKAMSNLKKFLKTN